MSFLGSSGTTISGDAVNIVEGDQINQNTKTIIIQKKRKRAKKERTLYDEFRYVTLGDIYRMQDLGRSTLSRYQRLESKWLEFEQSISVAKVQNSSSTYTVVSYHGSNAHAAWKSEFEKFATAQSAAVAQLFGINRSEIPALIFYKELIPVANRFPRNAISIWVPLCLSSWTHELNLNNLWMDVDAGRICQGPCTEAPFPHYGIIQSTQLKPPPLSLEFLREEVAFHHFSKLEHSQHFDFESCVVTHLKSYDKKSLEKDQLNNLVPFVIYTSSLQPIAVIAVEEISYDHKGYGVGYWRSSMRDAFHDDEPTPITSEDGNASICRFQLTDTGYQNLITGYGLLLYSRCWYRMSCERFAHAWLTQSPSIFHRLDMAQNEREGCFFLCRCMESLHGPGSGYCRIYIRHNTIQTNSTKELLPNQVQPIYLFVHTLPRIPCTENFLSDFNQWTSSYMPYWSLDELGKEPMSEDDRECLGLPNPQIWLSPPSKHKWPNAIYDAMEKWQNARGYNVDTTDFAESLGLPILEVVSEGSGYQSRFEVVEDLAKRMKHSRHPWIHE